ncbi:MAG: hypothetical protein ACPL6D_04840 [Thermodesulfobacteriota bacterium]
MMVKGRYVLAGIVILLIVIFSWKYFFPREEKRVIKQFELLSQYVEKGSEEDILSAANRMKNISQLFADPCEFKIEGDASYSFVGSYSREEIKGYALRGRSYFSELSLRFDDYKIEFPEKHIAQVRLTGRLTGKSTSGEQVDEVRELFCILNKVGKVWLFGRMEVVETLKR